jgi:hypothetical protein
MQIGLPQGFDGGVRFDEKQVDEKARSIMIEILHDYSAFQISTIDKFFQQVIRLLPAKLVCMGL